MRISRKATRPEKEAPKMVLRKVPIKWGRKVEFREVWMNATHNYFEK